MRIGLFEAKNHLSDLVERASTGETIIITRRGSDVAALGPVPLPRAKDRSAAIAAIRQLRRGRALGGVSLRELIDEGRP